MRIVDSNYSHKWIAINLKPRRTKKRRQIDSFITQAWISTCFWCRRRAGNVVCIHKKSTTHATHLHLSFIVSLILPSGIAWTKCQGDISVKSITSILPFYVNFDRREKNQLNLRKVGQSSPLDSERFKLNVNGRILKSSGVYTNEFNRELESLYYIFWIDKDFNKTFFIQKRWKNRSVIDN